VYCIDNVNNNLLADDLHLFVSSTSVGVISCCEVKPWCSAYQRKNDYSPTDHKIFILYINIEDSNLLLDADKWPSDITILAWFFKSGATAPSGSSAGNVGGQNSSSTFRSSIENVGLLVRIAKNTPRTIIAYYQILLWLPTMITFQARTMAANKIEQRKTVVVDFFQHARI